jgi:hypothetical protein
VICRFGHLLHRRNSTLTRHSKTGNTWMRCLICHAARQRKFRRQAKEERMTKLIALRVTLAVDDAVDIKDVKPRLSSLIAAQGTENLGENGESGGRIHWQTAEVLQGPERMPQRKGGKRVAVGQSEMLGSTA